MKHEISIRVIGHVVTRTVHPFSRLEGTGNELRLGLFRSIDIACRQVRAHYAQFADDTRRFYPVAHIVEQDHAGPWGRLSQQALGVRAPYPTAEYDEALA